MSPIGTPNHLGAELLAQKAGIDLNFVPYPGIGPATPDLLAGRTQIAISAMSSMYPHVAAGTLKALAVTRPVRSPFAPDDSDRVGVRLAGLSTSTPGFA